MCLHKVGSHGHFIRKNFTDFNQVLHGKYFSNKFQIAENKAYSLCFSTI